VADLLLAVKVVRLDVLEGSADEINCRAEGCVTEGRKGWHWSARGLSIFTLG
jgi:hypothetical protein